MTTTMVTAEAEQVKRLIEFASDVTLLAGQRHDLDLRALVDDLHADLIRYHATEED